MNSKETALFVWGIVTVRKSLLLFCAALIFLAPQRTFAYDNDTHFWLTYYLAIKAGYSDIQATQIASADVGVDFDKDTEPVFPRFFDSWKDWFHPLSHLQGVRIQHHALPLTANFFDKEWWNPTKREINDDHLTSLIDKRKKDLWEETLCDRKNPGVFFHYLQDTFAHKGFTSYVGHAGYYYVDFLDSDPIKAEKMAITTFKYLKVFREALLTKEKKCELFPDPEGLKLEDDDIVQIKRSVREFCAINPSKGVTPNILVEDWENLDDESKLKFKTPPKIYVCALSEIRNNGPAPDSR